MSARDATRTYCQKLPFEMTATEIIWNIQAQHPKRFKSPAILQSIQRLVSTVLQRRKGLEKGTRGKYYYSRKTPN